jgi:hypothetical protein
MIDLTKIGSLVSAVSQIGGHLGVDSPIVGQIKGLVSKALPVAERGKFDADMEAATAKRRQAHGDMLDAARGHQKQ